MTTAFKANLFRPDPGTPLYRALYIHIRAAILSGELMGGMKLPSTRDLAEEINISRNTVLNTYRQLHFGVINKRKRPQVL